MLETGDGARMRGEDVVTFAGFWVPDAEGGISGCGDEIVV